MVNASEVFQVVGKISTVQRTAHLLWPAGRCIEQRGRPRGIDLRKLFYLFTPHVQNGGKKTLSQDCLYYFFNQMK